MTTTIDQADSIVGINLGATSLDEKSRGWLRRGAYFDWLTDTKNAFWPNGSFDQSMPVEAMAGHIVSLHAAKKLKGDGLPEIEFNARNDMCGFVDVVACAKVPCSIDQTGRLLKLLNEFNSPPVRRLLAAFDVVEQRPKVVSLDRPCYKIIERDETVICWLVRKGAK